MIISGVALFIIFFILLILEVPIALALGLSSMVTLLIFELPIQSIPSTISNTLSQFTLLAIPFFFLAGIILEKAGISKRLIHLARTLTGHLRGGLAIVSVLGALFFSAISGSGPATMAAIGTIIIPAMVREGYRKNMAGGLLATAGGLGIIVPPSIAYIIYGVIAEVSIGELFIAGIVPGIILALALAISSYFIAKKENIPTLPRVSSSEVWGAFKDALWGLLVPVIILGGIYSGLFTPTESAVVAVFYGLFVGMFIYKEIKIKDLPDILLSSAKITSMIMLIVATASVFSWIITFEGIASNLADILLGVVSNKNAVLLVITIILLISGMFVDAISAFYIFLPIFLPIIHAMDIDPVHFGVLMTLNLAIGLITPPVGMDLYVASGLTGMPLKDIIRGVIPFMLVSLLILMIIVYVPVISLWLPDVLNF